jgi:Ca-activated chloride channel family protein
MRLVALTALLALALAAPALAQDSDGTPVVGGGSFNVAPILDPGRYRDTILPGEYLYYGFRLAAGQRLRVTLQPGLDNAAIKRMGLTYFSGNIHTPTRVSNILAEHEGDNPHIGFDQEDETLVISSAVVSDQDDSDNDGTWAGAGVYYLALHTVYGRGGATPPRSELPFTFDAVVEGVAQPNATPTATATPTPTATATAAPPPVEADDAGPPAALAAVAGVGGILVGVIAGIARRRRKR